MNPVYPPPASDETVRRRMQRTRRRDTKPEMALRAELHRRGRRYFVDRAPQVDLRRRADLVFPRARVAVYVDGCFWHACPLHATWPKANAAWWTDKLETNQRRDRDTDDRLRAAGWISVRVWEHESAAEGADRVEAALDGRSARGHKLRSPWSP